MNKLKIAMVSMAVGVLVGCTTQGPIGARERMDEMELRLRKHIFAELHKAVDNRKFHAKYAIPSDATIRGLMSGRLSDVELSALRLSAQNITREGELVIVYPAWIEDIRNRSMPKAQNAMSTNQYAWAREILWCASTTMVPEVDEAVRMFTIPYLNEYVNPTEWRAIESNLTATVAGLTKDGKYAEAIDFLKSYPRIRTYSQFIDKRLAAITNEVIVLGVDEAGVAPIRAKTCELVAAAAKILDIRDQVTNSVQSSTKEVSKAVDPNLEAYKKKLAEYRKTLVRFNCTEANADKIIASLRASLDPLLKGLAKDAVCETATNKKEYLYLGTMAVNNRTDKKVKDLIKNVHNCEVAVEKMKERMAALFESGNMEKAVGILLKAIEDGQMSREYAAEKFMEALRARVLVLVADGKFEEARELIWRAATTGDAELDALIFAKCVALLRVDVNPANWVAIEDEICQTVSNKIAAAEFDEAAYWVTNYPSIRQHTVILDEHLKRVLEAAEALGVDAECASAEAKKTCATVSETAKLVDHHDGVVAIAVDVVDVKEVDPVKLKACEDALAAYREKLELFHVNPASATNIVAELKMALYGIIGKEGIGSLNVGTVKQRMVLGTNAVNDRLADLVVKKLDEIARAKVAWKYSDLIERVRTAVDAGDFDTARAAIRDEELVGNETVDGRMYVLRVGLLNSLVNPRQFESLSKAIDEKVVAFIEAKDFEGLKKFIEDYPYVHDTYEQISAALERIKSSMTALNLNEVESAEYIAKVDEAIVKLQENREGQWSPDFDIEGLEKALSELECTRVAQYYKKAEIRAFNNEIRATIMDMLAKSSMTTAELNAALKAKLAKKMKCAEDGIYQLFLAEIDNEVSMDAQIAIAEEGIARQLGNTCEKASYKANALLGEYARAFRRMKKNATLTKDEATSVLLGAAYLDQGAVIPYAIKLGADIDGVSARDPRKRTALMLAIDAQNLSLVKSLVEAGASAQSADAEGNTVLHYSVKSGSLATVRAMAKAASITAVNGAGETPLFTAVKRNQNAMVQTVINLVAEETRAGFVNVASATGLTAFDLAAKVGSRDVLDTLAKAGAIYSEKDLILAVEGNHLAVAQWLVAEGEDVNAEGVMAKACPKTATGRYLIHEGGVGTHSCEVCQPSAPAAEPSKKAEVSGTITFSGSDMK